MYERLRLLLLEWEPDPADSEMEEPGVLERDWDMLEWELDPEEVLFLDFKLPREEGGKGNSRYSWSRKLGVLTQAAALSVDGRTPQQ